jgi:hypothetical protein
MWKNSQGRAMKGIKFVKRKIHQTIKNFKETIHGTLVAVIIQL